MTTTHNGPVLAITPIHPRDLKSFGDRMPAVAGRSLLSYTIEAALQAVRVDRILVSCSIPEVCHQAARDRAWVPFVRPVEWDDGRLTGPEVLHRCLDRLATEFDYRPSLVVFLAFTHPLRDKRLVDRAVETLAGSADLDSVTVAHKEHHAFWVMDEQGERTNLQEYIPSGRMAGLYQDIPGLVTVTRPSVLAAGSMLGERIGIVPLREASVLLDVFEPPGLWMAEKLLPFRHEVEQLL